MSSVSLQSCILLKVTISVGSYMACSNQDLLSLELGYFLRQLNCIISTIILFFFPVSCEANNVK